MQNRATENGRMLITVQVARVYASNAVYGHEMRADPVNGPIVINQYPEGWARASILLGAPPTSLIEAHRLRQAAGIATLEWFRGQNLSLTEALQRATFPEIERFASFTTLMIEREEAVPDAAIIDAGPAWLAPEVADELEERYSAEASLHIDRLAAYLMTIVDLSLFETVIYADNVFFVAPDRDAFAGFPHGSMSARPVNFKAMETLDLVLLRRLPQDIQALPQEKLKILDAVKIWLADAVHEQDPWKAFLWSFLVVEILSNKLFDKAYQQVNQQVDQRAVPEPVANAVQKAREAKDQKRDPDLHSKFTLVAYHLFPADFANDITAFGRAVKARNDLAHGRLRDASTLPIAAVRSLITKYLTNVMRSTPL